MTAPLNDHLWRLDSRCAQRSADGPMVARARAAYRESRPRFDRPLPAGVAHDYVDRAVRDLLGSIDVEALPEMAVRPAMARLQHRLFRRIRGYNAIQPG